MTPEQSGINMHDQIFQWLKQCINQKGTLWIFSIWKFLSPYLLQIVQEK